MTSPTNPYAAPRAPVTDLQGAASVQPVRFWPPHGRIGRLRYLAYGFVLWLVVAVASAVLGVVLGLLGWESGLTAAPAVAVVLVFLSLVILTIQRCHDVNWTGWLALLLLLPLVNVVFGLLMVFVPGSRGENRFGAPPPRNSWPVKALAALAIIVAPVGIVAAIALPAYQDYSQRARAMQAQ
jgi:uncharacterized membrane protein YhaH (DUF805 family)